MDNIDGTSLFIVNISLSLLTFLCHCLHFLFTFILAYCVNHLSSLKACVSSQSILAGIEAKSKGSAIWQSCKAMQTFQRKILLQNIFTMKDECSLPQVCCYLGFSSVLLCCYCWSSCVVITAGMCSKKHCQYGLLV